MGILQTAERSSHLDPSENVIYQRHLIAYKEAEKIISGTVLEIGSGEGYGITELAPKAEHYIAVDKYKTSISEELKANNKITFLQAEVPPLNDIEDNSVDFVVSFFSIINVGVSAPLNPNYTEAEFAFYFKDLKPKIIICNFDDSHPSVICAKKYKIRRLQ